MGYQLPQIGMRIIFVIRTLITMESFINTGKAHYRLKVLPLMPLLSEVLTSILKYFSSDSFKR